MQVVLIALTFKVVKLFPSIYRLKINTVFNERVGKILLFDSLTPCWTSDAAYFVKTVNVQKSYEVTLQLTNREQFPKPTCVLSE